MFRVNKLTYMLVAVIVAVLFIYFSLWGGGVATVHAAASEESPRVIIK